ncbi:hypothetical protein [Polyangium aurulentum]|uniref:hypothetical protein n=1 Tax=Polyangium aurulentum TaxID=2567896 RepID=UPI0010ADE475|nr:hypothetical protein [Polyangium aurulentum]UQA59608.1 hypothetical protein E8A73_003610 [Polyangium aurulentum]
MTASRGRFVGALVAVALGAAGVPARAAAADGAQAEALFRDAKRLMAAERHAEACPKLEESQRLDPGGGTLLNLAVCHEAIGKTATAWAEFSEALAQAHADRRADRESVAKERLAALEGKLSRLTVVLAPGLDPKGLEVLRDGVPLRTASFGVAIPVDPGKHAIVALSGDKRWETAALVGSAGDRVTVVVPAFEAAGSEGQGADRGDGGRGLRIAAWATGGFGVAAIGVGAVYGIRALTKDSEASARCPGGVCPDEASLAADGEARRSAMVANVAFGVGAASLGAATVLFLVSRSQARSSDEARRGSQASLYVAPVFSEGGGIVVGGAF